MGFIALRWIRDPAVFEEELTQSTLVRIGAASLKMKKKIAATKRMELQPLM